MRIHGDGREQALAAFVGSTTASVVTAAHTGHTPAKGVAVTLVPFEDLVLCVVVWVAVFDVTVGSHCEGSQYRELQLVPG